MPTVVVRHIAGDFKTWLKGHEERVRPFARCSINSRCAACDAHRAVKFFSSRSRRSGQKSGDGARLSRSEM